MTEQDIAPRFSDLFQKVVEANLIMEDGGQGVLGWKVSHPYGAATERLDQAINGLQQIQGAEKYLAQAHEVWADLARKEKLNDPRAVAEQHYNQAINILEGIQDFDDLARVVEKKVTLNTVKF